MGEHTLKICSKRASQSSAGWMLTVALSLAVVGFAVPGAAAADAGLQLIKVAPDGGGFVERDSGRPYVVFGTNYYDPNTGWAPKLWRRFDEEKVRRHFDVMRGLGVNCARVFLTAGSFQPRPGVVEVEALKKLDKLVSIAGNAGIRLILTGPDHWEGSPSYWRPDRFAGSEALGALEHFWQAVGSRYRGEPAIFAWDLLNEPHMPWFIEQWRGRWNSWLASKYPDWDALKAAWYDELTDRDRWGSIEPPKDAPDSGSRRLKDWQSLRQHLADEWVRRQVEAIRAADPSHLITVGYIQWSYPLVRPGNPGRYSAFNPRRQEQWLDFATIHFYPTMGDPFGSAENWRNNLDYLRAVLAYCHTGKPVVLGEYGWYGGGAAQRHPYLSEQQQADWLGAEIEASRALAAGWLSWPFADSPESTDISLYGGLVKADLTVKAWGRKFRGYAADLRKLAKPTPKLPRFDFSGAPAAAGRELTEMHRKYVRGIESGQR